MPGSNESIGHFAGRQIVDIMRNAAGCYNEQDLQLMKRAVGFIKRMQGCLNMTSKSEIEIRKSKAYLSLKCWGFDPLKTIQHDQGNDY